MRLAVVIFALTAATTLPGARLWAADCLTQYLEVDVLLKISACKESKCVTDAAKGSSLSPATALFAAARLADLQGSAADAAVLSAIPQDQLTFYVAYAITDPALGRRVQEVRFLFWRFIEHAAAAALRHPQDMPRFLQMEIYTDGETKAAVADEARQMKKKNPAAYCRAFSTFTRSQQELLSPKCK